jgi:uncharacterized protein YjbJ (UPF0337 family)
MDASRAIAAACPTLHGNPGSYDGHQHDHEETAMNWDRVEGNWKQLKGKVREQWGKLTDDHIDTINGRRDTLAGKIQEAYGIGKDEAERQISAWQKTVRDDADDRAAGTRARQ